MITPRGKFDLHILKDYLKIHGQTHDYKIPFKGVTKIFLLPHVDKIHIAFVLGIEPPIRQGNTSYPFLVFQIKQEVETTIKLNLPKEEIERNKILKSPLEDSLKGNLYDIVAKLFKSIIGVNIIIPGNFRSSKSNPSIRCSLKANEGFLYPLERGIIFIHKPVVYIKLEDINYVECVRVSESLQKSFDLNIYSKKNNESFQFLGILREEYDFILKYLALKKIKVKSIEEGTNKIIEVSATNKTVTSRRKKHMEENNNIELPSDEESVDENYNSDDMDVDDKGDDDDSEESGSENNKKVKEKSSDKKHKKKKKDTK